MPNGGSYSAIMWKAIPDYLADNDYFVSATGLPTRNLTFMGELTAREVIGHGLMRSMLQPGDYKDIVAMQVGNAYLRASGIQSYFRNDEGHNGEPGKEEEVLVILAILKRGVK
jgi:hypothetical protein